MILHGSAYDPQEGQIYEDDRLIWSSDQDGELGRGPTIFATNLAEGEHIVTLTSINSTGQSSSQSITVDITPSKSSAKEIIGFTIPGQIGISNIAATNHTVTFHMPSGTNLSALEPVIAISDEATISPSSGSAQDFSSPVIYTVTAQDGTNQIWTASCSSLTATPLVQVGNNPSNDNSVGLIVGLQNINDANSNLLTNPNLTGYTVAIDFNPQKVSILALTNLSTLGDITSDITHQIEGQVIISYTGLTDTVLNNLVFVSLNLIGTAEDIADVTVNFSSAVKYLTAQRVRK